MGSVTYLADKKPIPPKSQTFTELGQKYTCTFDPNAPKHAQWVWVVDYTRTYRYFGSMSTMEAAAVMARKRILLLNKRKQAEEENE